MSLLYLALLLASIAGVAALDLRWRLFFGRSPRRALVVVAAGTAFLLLWDFAGIAAGIFLREANPWSTGLLLAPHLPIEEPVFLAFLCQLTMTVHGGAERLRARRSPRTPEAPRAPEGEG